jgi:hypothetical protein
MAGARRLKTASGVGLEWQDIEQIGELEHALHAGRPRDESELASIPLGQFLRKEHHPQAPQVNERESAEVQDEAAGVSLGDQHRCFKLGGRPHVQLAPQDQDVVAAIDPIFHVEPTGLGVVLDHCSWLPRLGTDTFPSAHMLCAAGPTSTQTLPRVPPLDDISVPLEGTRTVAEPSALERHSQELNAPRKAAI